MNTYILLLGVVVLPFIIVWLVSLAQSFSKEIRIDKHAADDNIILMRAISRHKAWLIATTFWMMIEYLFVIIPFFANVIVIYESALSAGTDIEIILVFSIVSSAFIVFGFAINPKQHKMCYRKAYSCLDYALNEYFSFNPNEELLVESIRKGEQFIDGAYDAGN